MLKIGSLQGMPDGCGHSVALGIEVVPDPHGVAGFPLVVVLVHGWLQQEGVLALGGPDFRHALFRWFDENTMVRWTHDPPHLFVDRYVGILRGVHVLVLLSYFTSLLGKRKHVWMYKWTAVMRFIRSSEWSIQWEELPLMEDLIILIVIVTLS